EQSHFSLAPYCLEEACELIEAIEKNEDSALKDELGDVLFQVVLHAQLASERQAFTLQEVLENLNTKMVRRHPHVFADKKVTDSHEVWLNWEKIKKAEKKSSPEGFHIAPTLPALQTAYKIGVKTEKAGFDWSEVKDVVSKVKEELQELEEAISEKNQAATFEEMGDLLFSVAQLARHLDLEPEQSLRAANRKFETRYFKMLELAHKRGLNFENLKDSEKENLWQQIKERP
ncbi:MAG: nucleoside triphosphate pyrophosphohydrolase, partial [Bdellovibrionales bacterium]